MTQSGESILIKTACQRVVSKKRDLQVKDINNFLSIGRSKMLDLVDHIQLHTPTPFEKVMAIGYLVGLEISRIANEKNLQKIIPEESEVEELIKS